MPECSNCGDRYPMKRAELGYSLCEYALDAAAVIKRATHERGCNLHLTLHDECMVYQLCDIETLHARIP